MFYILIVAAAVILFALYKFLPNRKVFPYLCAAVLLVFCLSAFIQNKANRRAEFSREQVELIRMQQQIFSEWYADYQKDIDRLDRNWQLYYKILEQLRTAEIYEYDTYEQIEELEFETIDKQLKIHMLKVPPELDEECQKLLEAVVRKTQLYADAQTKTVTLAKAAANPETVTDLPALNQKLRDITAREAPAGLFFAAEISAIRDKLTVPGEGAK